MLPSNWEPKDYSVFLLALTVSSISIIAMIGVVFFDEESGRLEELIAFLLGSMTTIIGEYVRDLIKNKGNNDGNITKGE